MIYTGLIAGAFNTNSSVPYAFPAFYVPPLLSLMIVMLRQNDEAFFALAALFLIYIVLMQISLMKFHARLTNTLQMQFSNKRLADKLKGVNQQLKELADKDGLTQLYNRRSMDRYLKAEWERHYREQKPLSFLLLDVDYFKRYNDYYGHERGDECLIRIAGIMKKSAIRSTDMAVRYGGEEFALILPETDDKGAREIADRILTDIRKTRMPHQDSFIDEIVTASIGTATASPTDRDAKATLIISADTALYNAKKLGRNQVVQSTSCPL